jgi:Zn-dependent membrane protease YugP
MSNTMLVMLAISIIGLALSGAAAWAVRIYFARGQRVHLRSGLSGREVAERILADARVSGVQVTEHQGFLSDHYNPLSRTLALSPDVYHGVTAAAAGVAAHEVGHALQHARGYAPLWLRSLLVPVANLGSMLGPVIVAVGSGMAVASMQSTGHPGVGYGIAVAGVVLFAAAAAFTLVTVPVEFNASARARERLVALGITRPGAEDAAVRGVLLAAGLTYVAAAVTAILWLLYYLWQLGLLGGGHRDAET